MASEYCKFPHCECSMGAAERCKRLRTRPAPAATELARYDLACDFNGNYMADIVEVDLGEYVRYSQAEELLAAERAEKEQAKDDLSRLLVHFVREHFPENTTFKPFDDLIGLITQFDNASTIAREYVSRIHVLEAKLAAAENGVRYALANLRMNKSDEAFLADVLGGKPS